MMSEPQKHIDDAEIRTMRLLLAALTDDTDADLVAGGDSPSPEFCSKWSARVTVPSRASWF